MSTFQSVRCSYQWSAETLARVCNERAESAHSNLQLGKMFEVRNDVLVADFQVNPYISRVIQAISWNERAQYGVLSEKTTKICPRKSSPPSKASFVRRTCLRLLKKICELSTRNYCPLKDHVESC
jgi:hypothetical protein